LQKPWIFGFTTKNGTNYNSVTKTALIAVQVQSCLLFSVCMESRAVPIVKSQIP